MRRVLFCILLAVAECVILAAATPARAQVAYRATDLTPAGTTFNVLDYDVPGGFASGTVPVSGLPHAARRDLRTGQVTDLHPSSAYFASSADGAGGGVQVGHADRNPDDGGVTVITHAFLWHPGFTPLNLHPAGASVSRASDTDGVNHVGGAWFGGDAHALMWRGTSAANYVDLTPTHLGFTDAGAAAIHGGRQVGGASRNSAPNNSQAVLWSGTAASAVVLLPPAGFTSATTEAIHGGEQVGQAFNHGRRGRHAVVWHDAPDSVVDLHPGGFDESDVWDTNGMRQVGSVYNITGFPDSRRAAVWSGTAGSFVNLHDFLPAGYRQSFARSIDADGNVYGTAITADGLAHHFVWQPVPEPSAGVVTVALAAIAMCRRRAATSWAK